MPTQKVDPMQTDTLLTRENLLLLLALGVGFAVGLIVSRGGIGSGNRISANFVFGNIMIGSNNGRGNRADFGIEDSGSKE